MEVAAVAPRGTPAVLDDEGTIARRGAREVGGGVVVVPADDEDSVVGARVSVVVVARRGSIVVGGTRGRAIPAHRDIGAAVLHDRVLDVAIVERRATDGNPVDLLHVLARGQVGRSVAVPVRVLALVDRAAPTDQVGGGHNHWPPRS